MNTEIKESESASLRLNEQEESLEESVKTEGVESGDAEANDAKASDAKASDAKASESKASESEATLSSPEFQEFSDDQDGPDQPSELSRFQNIKVAVSAELGRAEIPIQTLMNLGEGSVLELNRDIDSPVELIAQGVALACGEVVVVDGCFAIRVTKVYATK